MKRTLGATALGSILLFTACTGTPAPPPESSSSQSATPAPSDSPTASVTPTEVPLVPVYQLGDAYLEIPEDWSYEAEACKGDCPEGEHIEIYDGNKERVLTLIPNTATSTDGDTNLYTRKVLRRTALPDQQIPGLEYIPTSVNAEYFSAQSQEDQAKSSGLSIAVVDDEVLAKADEQPALYYFKMNDLNWPMFYVEPSYLEQRIGKNPSEEAATQFVASQEYALIERVMLTIRTAGG